MTPLSQEEIERLAAISAARSRYRRAHRHARRMDSAWARRRRRERAMRALFVLLCALMVIGWLYLSKQLVENV
jgi:hypothetical protein